MRNFFGNIDDQSIEAFRLTGVGWIFAFFIVGATILAGRWLLGWQMRRIDRRILARKPEDGDEGNSDNNENPKV